MVRDADADRHPFLADVATGAALATGPEAVSDAALGRYGRGTNGIPSVALEEFPQIDRELLGKSWSPALRTGRRTQGRTRSDRRSADRTRHR